METMSSTVKHMSLLVIGGILGVVGVHITRDSAPAIYTFLQSLTPSNDSLAVLSCTPEMQEDDIFFVTCGGIY